jgi:hypothetical protein
MVRDFSVFCPVSLPNQQSVCGVVCGYTFAFFCKKVTSLRMRRKKERIVCYWWWSG